jgi:uncharacterized SAM-binding protein YcdF (DUF218 family)
METANKLPAGSVGIYILVLVVVGVCLGLSFLFIQGKAVLEDVGGFLVVDAGNLQPADLIHILGGRPERLNYGIQLYKAGYAPRLFITGGIEDVVKYREYALEQGVPAADIFPKESQALTTYDEGLALAQFLDQEPTIQSVIVVSSPYHTRRSQLIFDWLLGDQIKLQVVPVPFDRSAHQRRWWTDPDSRQVVIGEYLKILGLPFSPFFSLTGIL